MTDSQGRLAVPMYQDAELVSVQAEAGTHKGEPEGAAFRHDILSGSGF